MTYNFFGDAFFSRLSDNSYSLVYFVDQTFILVHQESIDLLEKTLNAEGFNCEVLKQQPITEKINYSRSYLCMMNHRRAWEKTVEQDSLGLIVEADFVPVKGMGKLPIPFPPKETKLGIAWLYTCVPRLKYNTKRRQGRVKGIVRLTTGKFLRFKVKKKSSTPKNMLNFARRRQLTLII